MIKLVIFDCDGTLVESEFLGHQCMEIKLRQIGIRESAEDMQELFRGWKIHDILTYIQKKHHVAPFTEEFIADYRSQLKELFNQHLKPVHGIKDALQQISLKKCVASSGPMAKIRHSLQLTGLLPYFDNAIFSAYDINSWKPAPDLFLHAVSSMHCNPAECIVVEDSEVGLLAAAAAKMPVIYFNPHNVTIPNAKADYEISEMRELPGLLKTLSY